MLELLYTSPNKTLDNGGNIFGSYVSILFKRDWDCLMILNGNDIYKVFRDGTSILVGGTFSNTAFAALTGGKAACIEYLNGNVYNVCEFTCQPIYTSSLCPQALPDGGMGVWANDFIDTDQGLIFHRYGNGAAFKVYQIGDVNTWIKTVTPVSDNNIFFYSYAGPGRLCMISTVGTVIIYDTVSWQVVQHSQLGININCAAYDCTYNLILALDTNGYMRVFSMNDLGNTLSVPSFLPGGNVYRYSGYKVKTRLTGVTNVGIPDKIIRWSLTNDKGWLEKPYSLTDENGYAYNYYFAPTDGAIGAESISVSCEQ
jgi:hypothetical protein